MKAVRPVGDAYEAASTALRPENAVRHPLLRNAAARIVEGRYDVATTLLRNLLATRPDEAKALYLLSEIATRQGRAGEALKLLLRSVKAAPDFLASRFALANALLELNRPEAASAHSDQLLAHEAGNPLFQAQKAAILEGLGDYAAAALLWRALTTAHPLRPDLWERYGTALRALGRAEESIAAYRKMLEIDPDRASAWWRLADTKTFQFDPADTGQMEARLERGELPTGDCVYLHFALGRAYADQNAFEKSFGHYARGNALRRVGIKHDPEVLTAYVARCKAVFTRQFFEEREGWGCASPAPIFLIGMPRSGSTLVEQILASHSAIEVTKELTDLSDISNVLLVEAGEQRSDYPQVLKDVDATRSRVLGESYIARTQTLRKSDRPHFTDKMGANFVNLGLIHLILPNARVVDVRRHPLGCCFSCFAQIFPEGQKNAYRLDDLGRYYRDYADLMSHFDRVLPGRMHRILYENLISEPEAEIRKLLNYLGLPFEESCLRFYETPRTIATVSTEQVRRPIYRQALETWRNYESWLGPLKTVLGPVLDAYPDAPSFD